jgi:hypothetical protein
LSEEDKKAQETLAEFEEQEEYEDNLRSYEALKNIEKA